MSRLLALRLCEHDSNMSYFDGDKVFYFKSERLHQIKHHAYDNLWEWKKDLKNVFNIDYEKIDEIAIILDPWRHKLPIDNEEFYPAIKYEYFFPRENVWRVNHHLCHALSCWPLYKERPKYEIVIDGFGDANNAWTVIKNNKIFKRGYASSNGSLGISMGDAGNFLNIESNNQEGYDIAGKLMGLQSYGKILPEFKKHLNYNINSIDKLFNFKNFISFKNNELVARLQPLDWIKTVHDKVSDILIDFFEEITDSDYNASISYSGGVAQNVIWNSSLKKKFKNLIIPPHCSDDGLSLGALEFLRLKNNLPKFKIDNFPFCQSDEKPEENPNLDTIKKTAKYLQQGKTVAWYQGKGEMGPRALGNRSLLFNPLIKEGKNIINKIKKRETYRPFGASILKEHLNEYIDGEIDNKYMLYVGKVKKNNLDSITHIDGTCRFQVVDEDSLLYYNLIKEFFKLTNCPLVLNTSFNINGKPIMSTIKDAENFFKESDIDILVIGNKIYKK